MSAACGSREGNGKKGKKPPSSVSVILARMRAATLAAALAACGSDGTVAVPANPGNSSNPPSAVAALTIYGPGPVAVGAVFDMSITADDRYHHEVPAPPAVAWSSSDTLIATITTIGRVTPRSPGTTTISAQADSLTATYLLTVQPPGSGNSE